MGSECIFEYHNGKTDIIRLNDQYIQQFGGIIFNGVELHRVAISKYMDAKGKKKLFDTIDRAVNTGKKAFCDVTVTNNAQAEYVRVTIRAIARTDDRVLCYASVVNMTKLRVNEIKARNTAAQPRTIMRSIHASVAATIFYDRNNMDVFFKNGGFYKMYGYTKEQFDEEVGDVNNLIVPEDHEKTPAKVEDIVRKRKTETHEFRCRKRSGEIILVKITNSVISLDGIGDNVLPGIATDVTAEKKQNIQLSFLNESAHDILAQPNCIKAINCTLRKILNYFDGKRVYIIEIDNKKNLR